jgi:hypothetical protein
MKPIATNSSSLRALPECRAGSFGIGLVAGIAGLGHDEMYQSTPNMEVHEQRG